MINLSLKQKIIIAIVAIGLFLIAIFQRGLYQSGFSGNSPAQETNQEKTQIETPKVISTNPSPLEGAVITPTQEVEIIFNKPLVNDPARIIIEPSHKIRTELSSDHKTMKVIPIEPYTLGGGYTFTIKKDHGFDTGDKLPEDVIFHFRTINYSGV